MCKEYYLSSDEKILLVRDHGESRILANWRDKKHAINLPYLGRLNERTRISPV